MNDINESPHVNINKEDKPSGVSLEKKVITIEEKKNFTDKYSEPENGPYFGFVLGYN
jgi:hypothetical protein